MQNRIEQISQTEYTVSFKFVHIKNIIFMFDKQIVILCIARHKFYFVLI